MIGVRARVLVAGAALAALLGASAGPGCGGRPGSCPGFDSCSDAKPCPLAHCTCDEGAFEFPATCGADGTCFTVSDCATLCQKKQTKCSKPPAACDAYLATECTCSSTRTAFAEAWDCTLGKAPAVSQKDCDDACGAKPGAGGAGGTGGAFPAVTSGGGSVPMLSQASAGTGS